MAAQLPRVLSENEKRYIRSIIFIINTAANAAAPKMICKGVFSICCIIYEMFSLRARVNAIKNAAAQNTAVAGITT